MYNVLTGKLIKVLPMMSGTGSKGQWVSRDFIIEYHDGSYTRKARFVCFGEEKVRLLEGLNIGEIIHVYFLYCSRELNGKWFDRAMVMKMERLMGEPSVGNDEDFSPDLP